MKIKKRVVLRLRNMASFAHITKLTEKDLTIKIVIPLLKKMGFESVTYTCGVDEFGRDIVCYYTNPLDDKKWVGIQVKAVDIHGTSSKSGNVQEIIDQIQEAFDNPFYHSTFNEEVKITEMYIVTSKNITPKAKRAINNKFKNKAVRFMDGQQLINALEKFVPDLLEPFQTSNAIKQRLQHLISSNKNVDDLREIEGWFTAKDHLNLSEKEMNFISLQILNYFFKNPSIRFQDKIGWDILGWLSDLKDSANIISEYLTSFIEDFPYYDQFGAPTFSLSFLKTVKKIKEICPSIYTNVKVPTSSFLSKIKKGINILGYPYNRTIFVYLMEESDGLPTIDVNKILDFPERYVLPFFIGMRDFEQAKLYLKSQKEPERFFSESLCFSVKCVLGEFRYSSSKIISKFAEFIEKSDFTEEIMKAIPPQYQVLLSLCLGREKETLELLNLENTFFEIYDGNYFPRAYSVFVGKPKCFFDLIRDISVPEIPEVYYEMAELSFGMKDFDESLRLADVALANHHKLKRDWIEKFLRYHKAKCLFELKRYPEALKILEALIQEDEHSASFYYRLYESCKKRISTNQEKK